MATPLGDCLGAQKSLNDYTVQVEPDGTAR